MRIKSLDREPVCEVSFLNAGKGQGSAYVDKLPVQVGQLSALPDQLDAIIATADLQGRELLSDRLPQRPRLLGEVLPDLLATEVLPQLNIRPERTGCLLAGDFYTVPNLDQRGGSGDVTAVWQAFAWQFKWVIGIAGNHDLFGESPVPSVPFPTSASYLDGEMTTVDGLTIGGIGGVLGNPRKPHRKTDQDFAELLDRLLSPAAGGQEPEIMIMHDGPNGHERKQRGSPSIRQMIERHPSTLVIRGHAHWEDPLAELVNGTQVLNVDCRVAILHR